MNNKQEQDIVMIVGLKYMMTDLGLNLSVYKLRHYWKRERERQS